MYVSLNDNISIVATSDYVSPNEITKEDGSPTLSDAEMDLEEDDDDEEEENQEDKGPTFLLCFFC